MKKLSENQKMIKGLRKATKAGLFFPIFYTIIFGMVIISVILLQEYKVIYNVLLIGSSLIIICFFWFFHILEKKNEVELNLVIDQIAHDLEHDIEQNSNLYLDETQSQIITDKAKPLQKYYIILALLLFFVSLFILFKDLIKLPQEMFILTLCLFGVFSLYVLIKVAVLFFKLYHIIKEISKESTQ